LIKERGLRFYAGVPLRSHNLSIGTLCIFDTKARRMTDREKRLLGVMAEDVMEEIQRRDTAISPGVLTIT
jgi:GAF domain-containing protein